jgi:predicted TIM-barrel fold metal-dependent hydrolase
MSICPFCTSQSLLDPARRSLLAGGLGFAAAALVAGGGAKAQSRTARPAGTIGGLACIDVHHHHVPPAFMDAYGYRDMPPFNAWSIDHSIAVMDAVGIETAICSLNAPGIFLSDFAKGRALARACNEFAADMALKRVGRYGFFAAIPPLDADGSLAEIDYAYSSLKADGVQLMTSYGGDLLGDLKFRPVLEELNRRRAVVSVHPTIAKPTDPLWMLLEMPVDTARTVLSLAIAGVFDDLPDIRFIFAHGGGALPILYERVDSHTKTVTRRSTPRLADRQLTDILKRVHFDIVGVTTPANFAFVREKYSTGQLLFGTDDPFLPAAATKSLFDALALDAADREAIGRGNALRLFPRLGANTEGVVSPRTH